MTSYNYVNLPDFEKDLPYNLPRDTQKAANRLAEIIGISQLWVRDADIQLVETLSGVILYPHLTKYQQHLVMQDILSYNQARPELSAELLSKMADLLVNPEWDPWSLSTEELEKRVKDDERILWWGDKLGLGIDIKSVKDSRLC